MSCPNRFRHVWRVSALAILFATPAFAASDLYVRDTASDTGVEPYVGPGPVYLSPDIWVRNEPDINHEPYPFSTAAPPWSPLPHQNPEYRDSKTGRPNYVYVRIHNRGDQPSSGTERLRLYQAKASTGLAWPASWVDNVGPACGADRLQGIEITKPRRNAKSVSVAERQAYRDALIQMQNDPQFQYSDGMQYWRKQNVVHAPGNPEHGNPAFFAWHREMMNRFEERLREADPLVTLLYWDWQQDPRTGTSLFDANFMGESNGIVAAPLVPLRPPTLRRNVGGSTGNCSGFDSDVSVNANGSFPNLATDVESAPNHNCAHGYIGGYSGLTGQISSPSTAAQDPFFFQLHSNVDRLWANWQRSGADPARIDPVAAFGSDSSDFSINDTMRPWDGSNAITPWTGAAAYGKTSKHPSVVFPPIYDTAPLNIPVLQPGQSVIVEIPWFPPNVNNFNCSGQSGHFCLLARIETETNAPYGMTFAEGLSVGANTTNNNNIAWKNLNIVDNVVEPSLRMLIGTTVRNIFNREAVFQIRLTDRTIKRRFLLAEFAHTGLVVPEHILKRLSEHKDRIQDIEIVRDEKLGAILRITGKEPRFSVAMKPNETFTAQFVVDMRDKGAPRELMAEPFHFDLEQRLDLPERFFGEKGAMALEIGGVRFTFDFAEMAKRDRNIRLADLRLELSTPERKTLDVNRDAVVDIQHLSPGEPVAVVVTETDDTKTMRKLSLELDGREVAVAEGERTLSQTVSFDEPGVHTIVTQGIDENGEVTLRRTRVLVSENIPPNAVITSPASGTRVKAGEPIEFTVETAAAFRREVREVSLYVKDDDLFVTGLDLVNSGTYDPIAKGEGPDIQRFTYTAEKPGMYMFQVGAVDDSGITGVSGHLMITVTE